MSQIEHNVRWEVALSNGENHHEGKGDFAYVEGGKSPWRKLQDYLIRNKCSITFLALKTLDGRTFNLQSHKPRFIEHMKNGHVAEREYLDKRYNPKFSAFDLVEPPHDYNMFRVVGTESDASGIKTESFTVGEAMYKDFSVQVWVSEENSRNCWTLAIPVHGT